MRPPFTPEQFFDVFRRYNEAVWPAQLLLLAIGLAAAAAAYRANAHRSWRWAQAALALLAMLWLWAGIAYHKAFFAQLTPVGEIFGSLFIAEAGLLVLCLWQSDTPFARASPASIVTGAILLAYALAVYPALTFLLGHRYPAMPTFGTPCPVTIFTFAIFCLLPASIYRFAMAIPILWAFIGSSAAIALDVPADAGLLVAALAAVVVLHQSSLHHAQTV